MNSNSSNESSFLAQVEKLYKPLNQVIKEEEAYLKERREKEFGSKDASTIEKNKFGIAFSGGGIRSSSVCLGVVKVLSDLGILQKADYISSVSGGGYTNAYIQATLLSDKKILTPEFIERMKHGGANYFAPGQSKLIPSKLVNVLNLLQTFLIGLLNPIILIFSILLIWYIVPGLLVYVSNEFNIGSLKEIGTRGIGSEISNFVTPARLGIFLLIGMIGYYFMGRTLRLRAFQFINIIWVYAAGLLLIGTLLIGSNTLFVRIQKIMQKLTTWNEGIWYHSDSLVFALGFLLLIYLMGWLVTSQIGQWMLRKWTKDKKKDISKTLIFKWIVKFKSYEVINNIAIALITIMLISFVIGDKNNLNSTDNLDTILADEWLAFRLLCLLILLGFLTNINLISLGRINGDSLTNAFGFNKSIHISKLVNKKERNHFIPPYPLFNCCVNYAPQPGISNLTADYYLLSPFYMGSASTGYAKPNNNITLTRAMATSAAAVNTGMGIFSMGIASILIGLANLRMGSLLFNPRQYKKRIAYLKSLKRSKASKIVVWRNNLIGFISLYVLPSIIWWPQYYIKSLLSSNSRNDTLLDISDGGHIENLAVFELLRRKCRLIIGIDAGMDSNYEFDDLKNLMKRAKNELNIELKFRTGYNPFEEIKPHVDANWRSKRRFGIADILQYKRDSNEKNPTKVGIYVYLKSSLLQDLGPFEGVETDERGRETFDFSVYKYMKYNIDFPHHSTADQFFNSTQFMAYYQLGQSLCKDLFPVIKEGYSRDQLINKFDKFIHSVDT